MKKRSFRNWFRIVWFSLVTLFFIWQWSTYQAKGVQGALAAIESNLKIEEGKEKISVLPRIGKPKGEVLFFPGGLVAPRAYLPLAKGIAAENYAVHIIKMPGRMATRGYLNIKTLFDLEDPSKNYLLGGHSQGGKMAAQFVFEHPKLVDGLFLLATSHPRDISLNSYKIPTIKIYAEKDGLASIAEVLENKDKLPLEAELKLLKGGNHSQFGYFGQLLMDGTPSINRETQHQQSIAYLTSFFDGIVNAKD